MLDMRLNVEKDKIRYDEDNSIDDDHMVNAKIAIEKSIKQTGPDTISYSIERIDFGEIIEIAHK